MRTFVAMNGQPSSVEIARYTNQFFVTNSGAASPRIAYARTGNDQPYPGACTGTAVGEARGSSRAGGRGRARFSPIGIPARSSAVCTGRLAVGPGSVDVQRIDSDDMRAPSSTKASAIAVGREISRKPWSVARSLPPLRPTGCRTAHARRREQNRVRIEGVRVRSLGVSGTRIVHTSRSASRSIAHGTEDRRRPRTGEMVRRPTCRRCRSIRSCRCGTTVAVGVVLARRQSESVWFTGNACRRQVRVDDSWPSSTVCERF